VRGGSVSLPREILLRLRRTGHAGARGQNGTYPTYRHVTAPTDSLAVLSLEKRLLRTLRDLRVRLPRGPE